MDDLTSRIRRTFGKMPLTEAFERTRAIVGPANMPATEEGTLAQQTLEALENGQTPDPRGLAALELMIKMMRPAPLSRGGVLDDLPAGTDVAFAGWAEFREKVKPFLYSIGRIDMVPDHGVGTGFLLAKDLLVTNAHVVAFLSRNTNELARGQAVVRFQQEYGTFDNPPPVDILEVVALDEDNDIALLRIAQVELSDSRRALNFSSVSPKVGEAVVAIGYPYNDPQRNPMFINGIFGPRFGVKRAAPGEILRVQPDNLLHDCSTLGGNSGSPLLSMQDAGVTGLHKEGIFMFRNRATPADDLKKFLQAHP